MNQIRDFNKSKAAVDRSSANVSTSSEIHLTPTARCGPLHPVQELEPNFELLEVLLDLPDNADLPLSDMYSRKYFEFGTAI